MRSTLVRRLLPWAGAALCAAAQAQAIDSEVNDGTWSAVLQSRDGKARQARVVISNFGGTWSDLARPGARGRPCDGRKFPITVQGSTEDGLAFTVWGSAVSPACPDISMTLKPVDARTFEGDTALSGKDESMGTVRLKRR